MKQNKELIMKCYFCDKEANKDITINNKALPLCDKCAWKIEAQHNYVWGPMYSDELED